MPGSPFDLPAAHRWFGIELNNRTWDALVAGDVTAGNADVHIHAAHASCYHWLQVGTPANHGRGECTVANVYAAAGRGDRALHHAQRYLALIEAHPEKMADWDAAFAFDALARAYAAAGRIDEARQAREQARAAGEAIAEEEDRRFFFDWFNGGNWHGLTET